MFRLRKGVVLGATACAAAGAAGYYYLGGRPFNVDDLEGVNQFTTHGARLELERRHIEERQRMWREGLMGLAHRAVSAAFQLLPAASASASASASAPASSGSAPVTPGQFWVPPSRDEQLKALKNQDIEYDILVVGGGATGVGIALDAASRGLKVALVEKDDFASGTSSRSTKLIHGGVRYLEKAVMNLDYEQYKLVREALHERANLLKIAPHLSYQLPFMLPIYNWWQVPYYWAGSKAYDLLAGKQAVESSYYLSKSKALEHFPMLKQDKLVGAMVYYDGAHNDSRMNVAIALTAASQGAVIANHVEVVDLVKSPGKFKLNGVEKTADLISSAVVRDTINGDTWKIKAKCTINATGPFTDTLRKLDVKDTKSIVQPSAGVHVTLPDYYSPSSMGLLDPATSDGRVIFFLPWQHHTIAGTTDTPTTVSETPVAKEEEIRFILSEVSSYLSEDVQVRRGDVLSAWSGIRPLVKDPAKASTEGLVRNHMINVSDSGLITIAGGKWTTYRSMALETVDKAIETFDLKPKSNCKTEEILLIGAQGFSKLMYIKLIQQFGIEIETAKHLAESYGDRAYTVCSLATSSGRRWPVVGRRLVEGFPYIDAEVVYAVRHEYAVTAVDVLARRTRLAFLNVFAAEEALPKIVEIMGNELKWNKSRREEEIKNGRRFLNTMGLELSSQADARSAFNAQELIGMRDTFAAMDYNGDGRITADDLKLLLEKMKSRLQSSSKYDNTQALIDEVDNNKSGAIEFSDFLEIMSSVKHGKKKNVKFAQIVEDFKFIGLDPAEPLRSGGGV